MHVFTETDGPFHYAQKIAAATAALEKEERNAEIARFAKITATTEAKSQAEAARNAENAILEGLTRWGGLWDASSRGVMIAGMQNAFLPFVRRSVQLAAVVAALGAAWWAVDRWKKIQKKKKESGERMTEDEERRYENRLRHLKKAKAALEDAADEESERDGERVHELLKGMEKGEIMASKSTHKKIHSARSARH
jgi:hypothetical protein